ncbi:MAG: rhodanese-like domain-containing protein, partial [Gemmatimonadota bacterium]
MSAIQRRLTFLAFGLLPAWSHAQTSPLLVSADWLQQHLRDPKLVVIHTAAQKGDYDAGHVPGARWLPWQAYTTSQSGLSTEMPPIAVLDSVLEMIGVADDSRIVITGGVIQNTARLFFTLDYLGLGDRTSLLDGGIDAWREARRPVETLAPNVARASLTLRPNPAKLVDASWLSSNLQNPSISVLDARVPEFYSGFSSNNNPRPGRVPGALNVPFSWLTGEFSTFREPAKLARLFEQAGVKKGTKVVTYCHVGMQASVLYLAARILGYDAAVYDGSFEDWSMRSDLP